MVEAVQFRVLGPLGVIAGNRDVCFPSGNQRILLASLLLRANEVVPVDELIDRLWPGTPPARPRGALQTCVTRLRRSLCRCGPYAGDPVHSTTGGYVIECCAGRLDLLRFRELAARARTAARRGDANAEAADLSAASALWRGPALSDVRSDSLHRDAVPKLAEERLRVAVRLSELRFQLGEYDESVADLRAMLRRHPFHERLWWLLMATLHRGGRRAEALAAFQEVSGRLRGELGVDPGPELDRLHLAILRGDPPPVQPLRRVTR